MKGKFLAVMLISTILLAGVIEIHSRIDPMLRETIKQKDYSTIFNKYIQKKDITGERPYYGDGEIEIFFLVDPESQNSEEFIKEYMPIAKEWADAGKAKISYRFFLTKKDYLEKSSRYQKSAAILCNFNDPIKSFSSTTPSCDKYQEELFYDLSDSQTLRLMTPGITLRMNNQPVTIMGSMIEQRMRNAFRDFEVSIGQ